MGGTRQYLGIGNYSFSDNSEYSLINSGEYSGNIYSGKSLILQNNTGNVGIGTFTVAPTAKLNINGTVLATNEIASLGPNAGFRVASAFGDDITGAPAYGIGQSTETLTSELGQTVQVSGYYGLTFKTRYWQANSKADLTLQNGKATFPGRVLIGAKEPVNYIGTVHSGITDPTYTLAVSGILVSQKSVVNGVTLWSDFVFAPTYKLPSLRQQEEFIKENGRLKDIPSEQSVKENGYDVSEMDARLLQKVEELYLYTIELSKQVESQKELAEEQKKLLKEQKEEIEELKKQLIK